MNGSGLIRVLICDEYELFRCAVASAFDTHPSLTVVGQADDLTSAIELTRRYRPDVVLLSLDLPGLEPTGPIRLVEQAAVLAVGERASEDALLRAVRAGMHGYATKDMELGALVAAVRGVDNGEAVIPPVMLPTLLRQLVERDRAAHRALQLSSRLTRREREVLELLVDGCDHRTVADVLVISPQTARTHIQNVINKLGVHSRLEAVALAAEHGLAERSFVGRGA